MRRALVFNISAWFHLLFRKYNEAGIKWTESNAILETNTKMSAQFRDFEHVQNKRRRSYIKKLEY